MGFLEKLGLHRKKKTFVPFTTEKMKKDEVSRFFNRNNVTKIVISLGFLILIIALYPRTEVQEMAYSIGEPWRSDNLTAPFTFSILKHEDEIQAEKREIRQNTNPIFILKHEAETRTLRELDTLFFNLTSVLEAYADWQESRMLESAQQALGDSLYYIRTRNRSQIGLDDNAWESLLSQHANDRLFAPSEDRPDRSIANELHDVLRNLLRELFSDGIIDTSKEFITTPDITIRDLRDRTEREESVQTVRTLRDAREFARLRLSRQYDDDLIRSGIQLFNMVAEPNLIYSEEDTEQRIQDRIDRISTTRGAVSAGQTIIRRGDIITPDRHLVLQSLAKARAERASDIEIWSKYTGETILVIAVFLIFFLYLYLYRRSIFDRNPMLLLVFLTIALVYGIGAFVARVDDLSPYLVPFAIAPILLTIIFDSRVGLMVTTLIALLAGLMFGNSFEFVVATVTACSIAVYSVRDVKDRSQFYITTPGLIFFAYAIVLFGFTLTKVGGWSIYFDNLPFLAGNAVGIWLTYPLILLIEKAFRITTDVTLLELSDTNKPILKRLMLEAPGTFHHSLQVANLSEAGAAGIGANALLCRVGALYHDIGKMEKPQYFVENQMSGNAHDKLKPRMSALIIKNHVDAGVNMAKEIELPEVIIDFIKTHHGTSLIRFFYEKAMNESGNEQEIQEEDFRYDGPIPNSKETGILLLADGVEAASRSMSDHSYSKLENLVNRMVDDRLAEGQLNNCALTLKDLKVIKDVFTRILQGMYHGRVKYPGQEEQESSDEDTGPETP
ncbi:MAG: HDIG domain-containing protein [Balneolaceae bacterium]|nr:MAG: HDIG domain-containing protein [Balneolaceae bacterium]